MDPSREIYYEHWTEPWQVAKVVHPGLSYAVNLNGRSVRKRMASATDIKLFRERSAE